jgi:DNA-binding LytR/AlgR family response regulator
VKQVTAILADDEENLRISLAAMLERLWPELVLLGQAQNGIEALDLIQKEQPDIAFLDIQMPGKTGLDVAQKVSDLCRIVFITAYDQYAVQAFESEAVDYILKPVTLPRLEATIFRLKKQLNQNHGKAQGEDNVQKVIQVLENRQPREYLRLVKVKTGPDLRFIPVFQILYFKAEDKYTIVRTKEKEFLIKTTIKELETVLEPKKFWRVHRSSIVNIDRIRVVKRSFSNQMMIGFDGIEKTIGVSRSYEHLFRQM